MSAVEPGSASSGLVDRVKSILLKPVETWTVIDAEPATVGGLYRGYIVPLAAIPAVCAFIGAVVFGHSALGVTFRPGILPSLMSALVTYVMSLVMVYVLALIIEALAPSFDGQKDRIQALKVAAYSYTAAWVAGVLQIFPPLAIVAALLGLYSLYLLYLGLPKLMKAPDDKALGYTVVTVIVAIVLSIIIGVVAGAVGATGAMTAGLFADSGAVSGSVNVNGQNVDLGAIEAKTKQLEAMAKQMESGEGAEATDPEVLKAYLPAAVAGFSRTELTTGSGGAAGMAGSSANGSYQKGDARMTLSVTDLGAAGALAGMASAFNVQSSTESEGRYEKIGKVDGRMTSETYDSAAKHGEYSVLVADRFMVAAEGDGVSMADLKAAVASVGVTRLEGLAKRG